MPPKVAAATKAPYDPVNVLGSMFNGSVTRVAYALKDPTNYAQATRPILVECAKRFHDALDDCEIQLLDAKWYLEHQLALNQAKRDVQAREAGTANKRKHEEIQEDSISASQDETPTKQAKVEDTTTTQAEAAVDENLVQQRSSQTQAKAKGKQDQSMPTPAEKSSVASAQVSTDQQRQQQSEPAAHETQTEPQPQPKQEKPPDSTSAVKPSKPPHDDFAEPTPQVSPAATNEDFNFESMFGDPIGDGGGESTNNNDLNFDLDMDDDTFVGLNVGANTSGGAGGGGTSGGGAGAGGINNNDNNDDDDIVGGGAHARDPSSLDSILPGLDDFANQAGDDLVNASANAGAVGGSGLGGEVLPTTGSNDWGLPDISATNDFDAFLNDDTFGADGAFAAGGDNTDKVDLSDKAMQDMNFDDFNF